MSSAVCAARSRTVARPPGSRCSRETVPLGETIAMNTVPTGLWSLPPSGPATPVMPTPSSTRALRRAPSAICSATAALTAPCASRVARSTPISSNFASFA